MDKLDESPVYISVKSIRIGLDGTEDVLTTVAKGKKSIYQDNLCVMYEEPKEAGFSNTSTLLKLSKDALVISRTGEVEHQQEFAENKLSAFYYKTPFMTIPMAIITKKFVRQENEKNIDIYLEYEIFIDGEIQGLTKLHILVLEDTEVGH